MTSMEKALIEAGVPLPPMIERVWRIVKESGSQGATSRDVAARMKHDHTRKVTPSLSDMTKRGMVAAVPEFDGKTGRQIYRYFTDMGTYRLLPPLTPAKKDKRRQVSHTPDAVPATAHTPTPSPAPAPAAEGFFDIDRMTIAQARALYQQLHKMFGGKS